MRRREKVTVCFRLAAISHVEIVVDQKPERPERRSRSSAVVARLHDEMVKAPNAPEARAKLNEPGLEVIGNSPEEFAAMMRARIDQYGRIARAAGLE